MATNRKTNEKVLYPELSYSITGILFSVHNEIGEYAREKQYTDLIEKKLIESKIDYRREASIGKSGNILDFIINNEIILELKSTPHIPREYFRQIQNYLQQTGLDLGLLINFRNKYIKPHRVIRIHS